MAGLSWPTRKPAVRIKDNEMIDVTGRRFIDYKHKQRDLVTRNVIEKIRQELVKETTIGEHTMVVFDDIIKKLNEKP